MGVLKRSDCLATDARIGLRDDQRRPRPGRHVEQRRRIGRARVHLTDDNWR